MNPNILEVPFFNVYIIVVISLFLLGLSLFLYIKLMKANKTKAEIITKYNQLESKLNTIDLANVESQLSPHLFKNILNTIQSHAFQTYFALEKLSSVLDYILYESKKQFVSPKEEIEFALNLIEINKIKISPLFDLKVKLKVSESEPLYEQNLIAPLITIDLIENAFKHADIQSSDAFISVVFELKDNVFSITVANKISTKPIIKKERSGIGSKSLEQRLNIIYKGCYKLNMFREEDVFISHLTIDLLEHKTKMYNLR